MVLPLRNHYSENGAYRCRFVHQNVIPIPGAKTCLSHGSQLTPFGCFSYSFAAPSCGPLSNIYTPRHAYIMVVQIIAICVTVLCNPGKCPLLVLNMPFRPGIFVRYYLSTNYENIQAHLR